MRLPKIALSKLSKTLLPLGLFAFNTLPALAHELWIEPTSYQISPQSRLVAGIVNGQKFTGHALPYLPRVAIRFELFTNGTASPITARAGDRPALDLEHAPEGLNVVVYQADNATLTYHDPEKFWSFVRHKDLGYTRQDHQSGGLPETEFKEVYSRYSKALIAVGNGVGADARVGLTTELVALANPYSDDISDGLPVQLFYNNAPRADAQIEVFDKDPAGNVTVLNTRTDRNGISLIPVVAGHHYMLDAVVLRPPSPELTTQTGAVLESLWANLTFAVPASN